MIADLHSHLPMHVAPAGWSRLSQAPGILRDRWRHLLVTAMGRFGNLEGPARAPRVSLPLLREGGAGVVLSVLYLPLEEMVFSPQWHLWELRHRGRRFHWAPPSRRAFGRLMRQLESVERHVAALGEEAVFVRDADQLDRALAEGRIALVHCVEGAFHLSHAPSVDGAVAELARRGVAYITIGHLYFRSVATVTPAWAAISEQRWHRVFPQPEIGLTDAGRRVIRAMVREGILIDVCHLSTAALEETFTLLDELDPEAGMPVIASHAALRGKLEYNLSAQTVERIAARDGLIGLIASGPHLSDGDPGPAPADLDDTMRLLFGQIDRLRELTGSHRHTAIGSDFGGFIQAAPGLENASRLAVVREALITRYGERDAELIACGNVIRLLRARWRRSSQPRR